MKTALCISGQLRSYKKAFKSIKEKILDILKPDVYISTWDIVGNSRKDKSYAINNCKLIVEENEEKIDLDFIHQNYNPTQIRIRTFLDEFCNKIGDTVRPEYLKDNEKIEWWTKYTLPMFYLIWDCNNMIKESSKEYDIVIRCRPDIDIGNIKLITNIKEGTLYQYPADNRKISDKFAIGNQQVMDYYSSVYKKLKDYWHGTINYPEKMRSGENLLIYHIKHNSDIKVVNL